MGIRIVSPIVVSVIANAGTPLLWFGCAFPFIGSYLVAVIEEKIIARFSSQNALPKWRPILWANIASTIVGFGLVGFSNQILAPILGSRPIERVGLAISFMWLLAYFCTILVEAPFFAKSLASDLKNWRVWKLILGVNFVTYLGLILVTGVLGQNTLGQEVKVVGSGEITPKDHAWIYYVASDGLRIRRVRLDGTRDEETQYQLPGRDYTLRIDHLGVQRSQLLAFNRQATVVLESRIGFVDQSASYPEEGRTLKEDFFMSTRENMGYRPGLSFPSRDPEKIYRSFNGYWAEVGTFFRNSKTKTRSRIACGTPFLMWFWHHATVLPQGTAVAQFGPQIVLIDIDSRRISWLANGTNPAVLLDMHFIQ